ncbi:UMP kinase [Candidatus Micrarchaeota archaeon]|nr:UMP kinase [Candidatus Micrarchaeota archaeon]
MRLVLSLGGSMVFDGKPRVDYIRKVASLVTGLKATVGVIVGGGTAARDYIAAAKEFGEDNFDLDWLATTVTWANARLCAPAFGGRFFYSIEDAGEWLLSAPGRTALLGGTHPNQTTDTVGAMLSEKIGADRWVNLSNVAAVYDKDPKKFRDARKFSTMTHQELVQLATGLDKRGPGENFIIDTPAARVLARSNIEAHFVNGSDLSQVRLALQGKRHDGTVVKG